MAIFLDLAGIELPEELAAAWLNACKTCADNDYLDGGRDDDCLPNLGDDEENEERIESAPDN